MRKTLFVLLLLVAYAAQAQQYKMAGPFEVVARDGEHRASKSGSERDMKMAWQLALEGRPDEARRIVNATADYMPMYVGNHVDSLVFSK